MASAVALADKFDTLTGIFGIGQAPKGSADPFALRRAALGALRIIVEKNLPLDLEDLVKNQPALFGDKLTNKKRGCRCGGLHAGSFPCMVSR